eukprot:XP_798740.3 PREDICTED: protein IWS1 homolog [Strongylocentrotus purpuratus]
MDDDEEADFEDAPVQDQRRVEQDIPEIEAQFSADEDEEEGEREPLYEDVDEDEEDEIQRQHQQDGREAVSPEQEEGEEILEEIEEEVEGDYDDDGDPEPEIIEAGDEEHLEMGEEEWEEIVDDDDEDAEVVEEYIEYADEEEEGEEREVMEEVAEEAEDGEEQVEREEEAKVSGDEEEAGEEEAAADAGHDFMAELQDEASDDDDEDDVIGRSKSKRRALARDSGDESEEEKEEAVGELIADIFGSSDEEEEFEGFGAAELQGPAKKKKSSNVLSSDDDDDNAEMDASAMEDAIQKIRDEQDDDEIEKIEAPPGPPPGDSDSDEGLDSIRGGSEFVSDFETMLAKKKEDNKFRRRKRNNDDFINDSDDIIMAMIKQMNEVAMEDRRLNNARKAATKKLNMLPAVMGQLKKSDLQLSFLECGVLRPMAEWLKPLPDKSLPHLKIRESFIKILQGFPPIDQHMLKTSEIGKAVMCLYRHPKELRYIRERAGKIINEWSRPIFGVESNFRSISKEDRQKRDLQQLAAKRRRMSSDETPEEKQNIESALEGAEEGLLPGMKGWVGRARVPLPSTKDYVVRPKWNVEREFSKVTKKKTRLDKHSRKMQNMKSAVRNKNPRAVAISIEGRGMSL